MFKGFFFSTVGEFGGELVSAEGINVNAGCDPTLGILRINWVVSGNMTGAFIDLYTRLIPAGSFIAYVTGLNPALGTYDLDLSVMPGFTNIDDFDTRVNLRRGLINLAGSPIELFPIYPCA